MWVNEVKESNPVGICFVVSEKFDAYTWAFTKFYLLLKREPCKLPELIVRNMNRALPNNLKISFPHVNSWICKWHKKRTFMSIFAPNWVSISATHLVRLKRLMRLRYTGIYTKNPLILLQKSGFNVAVNSWKRSEGRGKIICGIHY